MYKIIFDTNRLKSISFQTFLGYREKLKKLKKYSEFLIPDIVIDEIKKHKLDLFNSEKKSLEANPVYTAFLSKSSVISEINIEEHITSLENSESIPYETIFLSKQEGLLEKIRELAVHNNPPFEKSTDKGFKDAYIYFTTLEYVENQKEKVFVATDDGTLTKALSRHNNITVIKDFDEFMKNIIEQYKDDYFIEKIREELDDQGITAAHVIELWCSYDGNDVLLVEKNKGTQYLLIIENREIIDYTKTSEYKENIDMLIESNSFKDTHAAIAYLQDYYKYFSASDIDKILNVSVKNYQIHNIAHDEDVKSFLLKLYEFDGYSPSDEVINFIKKLKNDTN